MSTLTSAPLAPLLDRLFEEASRQWPENHPAIAALPAQELTLGYAEQGRLPGLLREAEGFAARGIAGNRQAAVHAGPEHTGENRR